MSKSSLLACALLFAGCGPSVGRDQNVVFYASGADLQSINSLVAVHPLAKQVQKNVLFMTLVRYDGDMKPVPRLATPVWGADHRSITFNLRHDVMWHDSVRTTGADVKWTLDMARDPQVAYPRARDLEAVAAVDLVDSFTVRVRFSRAVPVFPDVFTDLAILPAHRFENISGRDIRNAPFSRAPVGNGPFQFSEYQPGQRWVFKRSEGFPSDLGPAKVGRLAIIVVDEPATKLAALTSGELDFAGIAPAHADIVRKNPKLQVIDYPILFSNAVFWNLRRPPFNYPPVREALDRAIDRNVIVQGFLHGFGKAAGGPVPPEHPWYEPVSPSPHDTAAASRLLEQAGWKLGPDGVRQKDGKRLAFDLLTVGSGDNLLEQMLQAQFKSVGAEMRIRQIELSAFLGVVQGASRDFDAALIGVTGDLSLGYLRSLYDSRDPGPLAYAGYQSPALDSALADVRSASSEAQLSLAWHRVQQVLNRDWPTSWLYHARGLQGVNRRIENVTIDLRGRLANVTSWTIAREGAAR